MNEVAIEEIGPNHEEAVSKFKAGGATVLTHHGTPVALLFTLDNYDQEDIGYMTSPAFWKMIDERRAEPTIPWEQAKREIFDTPSDPER